jgi:hypothetical protein
MKTVKTPLLLLFLTLPAAVNAQFTFVTNNGAITITGYTGPRGAVVIPATTNGYPVTSIGPGAFQNQWSMTSVTIPDSITNIGSSAFQGCYGLTSVAISAFVNTIGSTAFSNCRKLTAITVNPENPSYSSANGVLFNRSQTTLIQYPGGLSGNYVVPDSVTDVGSDAFHGCTHLTSVTISSNVTYIGYEVFEYCTSLTAITMDTNNPAYASVDGVLFDKPRTLLKAFPCGRGGSYAIPAGVTNIDFFAFAYCGLTNVTIPASVTTAGDWAFVFSALAAVYFQGDAPGPDFQSSAFGFDNATVYYLPGTAGWDATFAGLPTALWFLPNPLILTQGPGFGVQSNGFGFVVSWATNLSVVVEAATNLASPVWVPLQTNALTDGVAGFNDPQWTNYPGRFYRLRSP